MIACGAGSSSVSGCTDCRLPLPMGHVWGEDMICTRAGCGVVWTEFRDAPAECQSTRQPVSRGAHTRLPMPEVLAYRSQGWSYDRLADKYRVSRHIVQRAVATAGDRGVPCST